MTLRRSTPPVETDKNPFQPGTPDRRRMVGTWAVATLVTGNLVLGGIALDQLLPGGLVHWLGLASITHEPSDEGVAVGTNVIYAAIHQLGGTIRAKTSKGLRWRSPGNGGWVT